MSFCFYLDVATLDRSNYYFVASFWDCKLISILTTKVLGFWKNLLISKQFMCKWCARGEKHCMQWRNNSETDFSNEATA